MAMHAQCKPYTWCCITPRVAPLACAVCFEMAPSTTKIACTPAPQNPLSTPNCPSDSGFHTSKHAGERPPTHGVRTAPSLNASRRCTCQACQRSTCALQSAAHSFWLACMCSTREGAHAHSTCAGVSKRQHARCRPASHQRMRSAMAPGFLSSLPW